MPGLLAQCDGAADRDASGPDGWHELAVANPTLLLERLGSECTDLQGLRELTVNGLDAIAARADGAGGRVVWDLDWQRFDASGGRVRKLSVIDTGTGTTPEQLRYYINQLAASGREQSGTGNFGVRAKVAAGSRNPHDSNTARGTRTEARWCVSSATPTAAGGSSHSAGTAVVPTTGARSARRTSPGYYADGQRAPRSCCSASMRGTTQRRHRTAPATLACTGSRAT